MAKLFSENSLVIDSNVWVSALVFGGNPRLVFEHCIKSGVIISVCPELISEARRIILKKFKSFTEDFEELVSVLEIRLNYVMLGSILVEVCRDDKDNYLIETAIISKSRYLISGDKDLLSLKKYKGIIFLSPADYLERLG